MHTDFALSLSIIPCQKDFTPLLVQMIFWWGAAQIAAKMDRLRVSEAKLLAFSQKYHPYMTDGKDSWGPEITVVDTNIPRSVVPGAVADDEDSYYNSFLTCGTNTTSNASTENGDPSSSFVIHSIQVKARTNYSKISNSNSSLSTSTSTPLVLLHGYMNGGVYFYRNFLSLSRYFDSIHSLDLLGWGLSSRPSFRQIQSTSAAESFFVESLEAWRKAQQIDKMILAGHSMGGYLSVAYCERYPQHVERLILLSPVGVPKEDANDEIQRQRNERIRSAPWKYRLLFGLYNTLYQHQSIGDIFRWFPSDRAKTLVTEYANRRLKFSDSDELNVFIDYLYEANSLPGSGEYCLNRILHSNVMAKEPLEDRIPKLQQSIKSICFLYGANDWMDITGGLKVQEAMKQQSTPPVEVYRVNNAGHLLQLEHPEQVSTGVILSSVDAADRVALQQALSLTNEPEKVTLSQYMEERAQAKLSAAMKEEEEMVQAAASTQQPATPQRQSTAQVAAA